MNDFLTWLYDHFIKPQVLAQPIDDGDAARASALDSETTREEKGDVAAVVRFYATHAFLLGLRTGTGLAPSINSGAPLEKCPSWPSD